MQKTHSVKLFLHQRLDEGLQAVKNGRVTDADEFFKELMDIANA